VKAEPRLGAAVEGLIAVDDYGIIASYKKGGKSLAALDLGLASVGHLVAECPPLSTGGSGSVLRRRRRPAEDAAAGAG
jgi:hypothetical protein